MIHPSISGDRSRWTVSYMQQNVQKCPKILLILHKNKISFFYTTENVMRNIRKCDTERGAELKITR